MTGMEPRLQNKGVEPHKMDHSAYKIIEGTSIEAYAKPNETALHSKTVVHASSLGQVADAIKRDSLRRKIGIDADKIDDLILYASQRKPPSSPLQSPSASLTAPPPSMAPGIGGFNIDAPIQKARLAKGDTAVAHMPPPASPRPNLVSQPPLQAQRMIVNVESDKSSLVSKLFAIIAIAGGLLLGFRDEIRNQLSDSLQTITPLCNVSSAETSARQIGLLVESQKGLANELSPLGISPREPSAHGR